MSALLSLSVSASASLSVAAGVSSAVSSSVLSGGSASAGVSRAGSFGGGLLAGETQARRLACFAALPKLSEVIAASQMKMRFVPEMVSSGISAIDALTGGLPRGGLTEIFGEASSGRASLMLAAVAAATQRQQACALVDVSDSFHPRSAVAAGVEFKNLLWIRCGEGAPPTTVPAKQSGRNFSGSAYGSFAQAGGSNGNPNKDGRLEQALRVTDLLLQSGGFGLIVIDLGGISYQAARRVPLASWFRFQRVIEATPTVMLVITQAACTQSSAAMVLELKNASAKLIGASGSRRPAHAELMESLRVRGELLRSRFMRKPPQSVTAVFETKSVRVG